MSWYHASPVLVWKEVTGKYIVNRRFIALAAADVGAAEVGAVVLGGAEVGAAVVGAAEEVAGLGAAEVGAGVGDDVEQAEANAIISNKHNSNPGNRMIFIFLSFKILF
jgi:hypothetical protein